MAKTFNNLNDLFKHIEKNIDDILYHEMAKHVKDEIQTAVSEVVYQAGTPEYYVRRGGNQYGGMGNTLNTGSLADQNEMDYTVKNGELKVVNNAERNKDYSYAGYGYDWNKSLAENIEYGYADKSRWFNEPRPFMKRAVENMKDTNSHVEVMKEALEKRGIKTVK